MPERNGNGGETAALLQELLTEIRTKKHAEPAVPLTWFQKGWGVLVAVGTALALVFAGGQYVEGWNQRFLNQERRISSLEIQNSEFSKTLARLDRNVSAVAAVVGAKVEEPPEK